MFVLELPFVQKNAAVAALRDGLINWQMDKLKGVGERVRDRMGRRR